MNVFYFTLNFIKFYFNNKCKFYYMTNILDKQKKNYLFITSMLDITSKRLMNRTSK